MSQLSSDQAVCWIDGLIENLAKNRRRRKISSEERLAFLSEQYMLIFQLNRAISGQVLFTGAPPIAPPIVPPEE